MDGWMNGWMDVRDPNLAFLKLVLLVSASIQPMTLVICMNGWMDV